MNFLAASIESLGAKVVGWFTVGYGMFAFLAQAGLLRPSCHDLPYGLRN